jgi:L-lactate dehydrogenase (cytochrome)
LESAPPPIDALARIRAAVGPGMSLFYDSGLRSGEDVLKALGQGADFTFLGRILQFAIAAAGEEGLQRLWEVLSAELSAAMAQTGRISLETGREG